MSGGKITFYILAMLYGAVAGSFNTKPGRSFLDKNTLMERVAVFAVINHFIGNSVCLHAGHFVEQALPVVIFTKPAG